MSVLRGADLAAAAACLDGWSVEEGGAAIKRQLAFANFSVAFAFMTAVALRSERLNHHPEWSNIYSRVDVRLTSHDAGGVTERDLALARFIDEVAASLLEPR